MATKPDNHRKDRDDLMYGPRVLVQMAILICVVAIAIYVTTGSILTALWQTVLTGVGLQAGYGALVLYRALHAARISTPESVRPDNGPAPLNEQNPLS